MPVALPKSADAKLSNILRNFAERSTKVRRRWFNTITASETRRDTSIDRRISPRLFFSYATMMQNFSSEWLSAEVLKENIGGEFRRKRLPMANFLPSLDDPLFLTLYKEMYFRHIYASKPVRSLSVRRSSDSLDFRPFAGRRVARRTTRILHELHRSVQFGFDQRSAVETRTARSVALGHHRRVHLSVSVIL